MLARKQRRFDAVWLFLPTYAIHLAEEYFAGDGFVLWIQRTLGVSLTNSEFVAWNAFALGLMCVGVWLVSSNVKFRFIEIALALSVLGNAAAHLVGTLLTWTYSPGLVTATFVWVPLGVMRLRSAIRVTTRRGRLAGTYLGISVVVISLAVVALAAL